MHRKSTRKAKEKENKITKDLGQRPRDNCIRHKAFIDFCFVSSEINRENITNSNSLNSSTLYYSVPLLVLEQESYMFDSFWSRQSMMKSIFNLIGFHKIKTHFNCKKLWGIK